MPFSQTEPKLAVRCLFATCALAVIAGGCSRAPQDQAREDVQRIVQQGKNALQNKETLAAGTVVTKNSTLVGNDDQGRPLWKLSFKEGRLHGSSTDLKSSASFGQPQGGDLIGASAVLYREGKPESSFRAAKINFADSPKGLVLTMTGGVQVHATPTGTNGKPNGTPVDVKAPRVQVNVKSRQLRADGGIRMGQSGNTVVAKQLAADSGLTLVRVGGGVQATAPNARITAQNAVYNWTTRRLEATGKVEAVSSGQQSAKITGTKLEADTNGQRGVLSGTVRVAAADGSNASAGRVLFNWNAGTISAHEGVTLTKDGATLRTARLDSDKNLARVEAAGSVTLMRGTDTVSASQVQAYDRVTRIVASGGVSVRRPGVALDAGNATVWLNEKRASASGDVTLRRDGATLRASNADYWMESGRAVASGSVTLVRDDVTVTAGRVESANIADKARATILASNGVTARGNGGEIRASRVTWGNGRAIASGGVTLAKSGSTLRGQRLETDANFQQATLSGDVGGNLRGGTRFSSSDLTWTRVENGRVLPRNGRILGQGGVVLRNDSATLRGARLEAAGDGSNAVLSGGIVATDGKGARVQSNNARYDGATSMIYASGSVSYRDANGTTLQGSDLVARIQNGRFVDATLKNVRGRSTADLLKGKTLFGN